MLDLSFPILRGADWFSVSSVPLWAHRSVNFDFPRHGHDFHELVFVVNGSAFHQCYSPQGDEGQSGVVRAGDAFLLPVGWSHGYEQCREFEIFNVLFAPSVLRDWPHPENGFALTRRQWSLLRGEREHLETLLLGLMRELTWRQRAFETAIRARFAQVLIWLDRLEARPVEGRAAQSHEAVMNAVAFLEKHFAEPVKLADIARAALLSEHYFCEVFKATTGRSPGRYLLQLRLEHARFLLLTTGWPVTQVARASGFADTSYFARAFKTEFGTAPTRLRSTGR